VSWGFRPAPTGCRRTSQPVACRRSLPLDCCVAETRATHGKYSRSCALRTLTGVSPANYVYSISMRH